MEYLPFINIYSIGALFMAGWRIDLYPHQQLRRAYLSFLWPVALLETMTRYLLKQIKSIVYGLLP